MSYKFKDEKDTATIIDLLSKIEKQGRPIRSLDDARETLSPAQAEQFANDVLHAVPLSAVYEIWSSDPKLVAEREQARQDRLRQDAARAKASASFQK